MSHSYLTMSYMPWSRSYSTDHHHSAHCTPEMGGSSKVSTAELTMAVSSDYDDVLPVVYKSGGEWRLPVSWTGEHCQPLRFSNLKIAFMQQLVICHFLSQPFLSILYCTYNMHNTTQTGLVGWMSTHSAWVILAFWMTQSKLGCVIRNPKHILVGIKFINIFLYLAYAAQLQYNFITFVCKHS